MWKATLIVGAVVLALAQSAVASPMKPLAIFVVVGQSNAAGYGQPVPAVQATNPRVWDLTGAVAVRARQPLGDAPGVGSAISFATVLAKHGMRVGLVQCARGGVSIDLLLPGGDGVNDWHARCMARIESAKKYGTIRGILFSQGESDMRTREMAEAWLATYRTVIGNLGLNVPVIMQLTRDLSVNPLWELPFGAQVRSAQRSSGAVLVSADDLPVDGQHFTPDGYRMLGERMAAAWLARSPR